MRKLMYIIITVCVIVFCNFKIIYADDILEEVLLEEELEDIIQTSSNGLENLNLNCKIAVAFDRESGEVIWGKNENKRTAMASTTKIMTAIVALEEANLSDITEVSAKAAGTGGSRLGLKKGDKISLKDLLYGLMLKSGNDAAVAIAEHVGGNVESFAELMNKKARELKLQDTNFVTPHGLDDPNHYTTAVELAKLTNYALKNDTFSKIVGTKNYTVNINGYPKNLSNTNELLGYLNGVYGVKTGFTNNAGRCLVTAVNRDNFNIITVVIQADTKKDRTRDSINLIEYVYKNYEKVNIKYIVDEMFSKWCNINKERIYINKAKNHNLIINYEDLKNDIIVVKKVDLDNIRIEINCVYNFEAPLGTNTIIGELKVLVKDDIIDREAVYIENSIEKKDVWDYFVECIKSYAM